MYLMKENTSIAQSIRDQPDIHRHELADTSLDGALFIKVKPSSRPWWIEFLNPLSSDELPAPTSRSISAVLALRIGDDGDTRTVCYTFGYGRYLLDSHRIDQSFGLKVVLNTIDPHSLRSLDARRQDDIVVTSRIQSSIGTDLAIFNLDTYRDILTRAVGMTQESLRPDLGTRVQGSSGLSFNIPISAHNLAIKAQQVLGIYCLDDYREQFQFVDQIRPVDPSQSADLDDRLIAELSQQSIEPDSRFRCLYLAPPEILDWEGLEGFSFSSESTSSGTLYSEIRLDDYLDSIRNRRSTINTGSLRRDYITLLYEGQPERRLASIYRCIIAELELSEGTFQLVDGNWYELERSFVEEIRNRVSSIPISDIDFPSHQHGDHESTYNEQAAERLQALLMDRHLVGLGGGRNRIEVCDLLLDGLTFVHVKKRSSSSTLSHLWSQGTVAMEALLSDGEFREAVRQRIGSINPEFKNIVDEDIVGTRCTLIYLIVGTDRDHPASGLPFFSQVALIGAVQRLTTMGINIRIAGVPSVSDKSS